MEFEAAWQLESWILPALHLQVWRLERKFTFPGKRPSASGSYVDDTELQLHMVAQLQLLLRFALQAECCAPVSAKQLISLIWQQTKKPQTLSSLFIFWLVFFVLAAWSPNRRPDVALNDACDPPACLFESCNFSLSLCVVPPLHPSLRGVFPSSSPRFLCCCSISSPLFVLLTLHLLLPLIPASLSFFLAVSLVLAGPLITALIIPVHLSSRTAPVMACSTTPPWAEMLLVPHQSTSCPVRCLKTCTVESHNRSAGPGCFSRLPSPVLFCFFSILWCSAKSQDFHSLRLSPEL